MIMAIFIKIHSWKEDIKQYILTDFAAITATQLTVQITTITPETYKNP
jgi:hypothetical protein